MLILEELDFTSLLNVAQTNGLFSILATDVFNRKFSNYKIVLKNGLPPIEPIESSDDMHDIILGISSDLVEFFDPFYVKEDDDRPLVAVSNKQIEILNFDLSLTVLKYFGHVIRNLEVDYSSMDMDRTKKINQAINKYCSNMLIQYDLQHCNENSMEKLTGPFVNVENVSIGSQLTKSTNESLPLDQLFPNIKNLYFDFLSELDESYTDCYMSHLEHLSIGIAKRSSEKNEPKFENLIKRNPHIFSIALDNISSKFLSIVNELLPNLQDLTLWTFEINRRSIHFENVKTFETQIGLYSSPVNITFSKLEELRMSLYIDGHHEWIDFFRNHSNLKRLHMKEILQNRMPLPFEELMAELPHLEEMSMRYKPNENVESIIVFLNNHKKLVKFELIECSDADKAILRNKCEHEWSIHNYRGGLSFQRRG